MGKPLRDEVIPPHMLEGNRPIMPVNERYRIRRLPEHNPGPDRVARLKVHPSQSEAKEIPEDSTDLAPRFLLKSE